MLQYFGQLCLGGAMAESPNVHGNRGHGDGAWVILVEKGEQLLVGVEFGWGEGFVDAGIFVHGIYDLEFLIIW